MITVTGDGSCHHSRKCGGWAAIVRVEEPGADAYSYRVAGQARTACSHLMEIAAVVEALDTLPKNYRGLVRVVTDHTGLADRINRHVPRRRDEDPLEARLREHTMNYRVSARWVRSHTTDPVHEFADRLSKERSRDMLAGRGV